MSAVATKKINLRAWRIAMATACYAVAFFVCLPLTYGKGSRDNVVELFALTATNMTGIQVVLQTEFGVRFLPFLLLVISAVFTTLQAIGTPRVNDPQPKPSSIDPVAMRWLDWCITVPVMLALISALCGVRDVWLVADQAILGLAMIVLGIVADELTTRVRWIAYGTSSIVLLVVWTVICWHLSMTEAPGFVYGIVVSQALMFVVYPIVALAKMWGIWNNDQTEKAYVITGTITKTLLAVILAGGVRQTSS